MFCHALSCEKISSQKGKVVNSLSQNFQTKNGESKTCLWCFFVVKRQGENDFVAGLLFLKNLGIDKMVKVLYYYV